MRRNTKEIRERMSEREIKAQAIFSFVIYQIVLVFSVWVSIAALRGCLNSDPWM